jgi:hypothetical protein
VSDQVIEARDQERFAFPLARCGIGAMEFFAPEGFDVVERGAPSGILAELRKLAGELLGVEEVVRVKEGDELAAGGAEPRIASVGGESAVGEAEVANAWVALLKAAQVLGGAVRGTIIAH